MKILKNQEKVWADENYFMFKTSMFKKGRKKIFHFTEIIEILGEIHLHYKIRFATL